MKISKVQVLSYPGVLLRAWSERGVQDTVYITLEDVEKAPVGTQWQTAALPGVKDSGREIATVVFKDSDGALMVVTTESYLDAQFQRERRFIWFDFASGGGHE